MQLGVIVIFTEGLFEQVTYLLKLGDKRGQTLSSLEEGILYATLERKL